MTYLINTLILLLPLFFCGCTASSLYEIKSSLYKPYKLSNSYVGELPERVNKVMVLPLYSSSIEEPILRNLDKVFRQELQRMGRFETVVCNRDFLFEHMNLREISPAEPYPSELFNFSQNYFDADAILIVEITNYNPYQPISIGVKGRLIDIGSGETIWSVDEVFDSGNPHVQTAAGSFESSFERIGYPLNKGTSILKSPLRYSKYVAHEIFKTLPSK